LHVSEAAPRARLMFQLYLRESLHRARMTPNQPKSATAKSQIEILGVALDAYRLDNGAYPTSQQGLEALWTSPTVDPLANWRGSYLRKPVPVDPWGRPYMYAFPGQQNPIGYDLLTYGLEGQPGGDGGNANIVSWK
jgi:general secretion pathway protein G